MGHFDGSLGLLKDLGQSSSQLVNSKVVGPAIGWPVKGVFWKPINSHKDGKGHTVTTSTSTTRPILMGRLTVPPVNQKSSSASIESLEGSFMPKIVEDLSILPISSSSSLEEHQLSSNLKSK